MARGSATSQRLSYADFFGYFLVRRQESNTAFTKLNDHLSAQLRIKPGERVTNITAPGTNDSLNDLLLTFSYSETIQKHNFHSLQTKSHYHKKSCVITEKDSDSQGFPLKADFFCAMIRKEIFHKKRGLIYARCGDLPDLADSVSVFHQQINDLFGIVYVVNTDKLVLFSDVGIFCFENRKRSLHILCFK